MIDGYQDKYEKRKTRPGKERVSLLLDTPSHALEGIRDGIG
jgi:hypothetical protein